MNKTVSETEQDAVGGGAKRRIGMALYGDLTHDSRVQREALALAAAGWSVSLACLAASDHVVKRLGPGVQVLPKIPTAARELPWSGSPFLSSTGGSRRSRVRARIAWLVGYWRNLRRWGTWAIEEVGEVDVWHAHDLTALISIAPHLSAKTTLVYDSHEIYLDTGTGARLPGPAKRILRLVEGRLARRAAFVVTVNEGVAAVLQHRYKLRRIVLVHNCPPRWDRPAHPPELIRRASGISPDDPVLLFHGSLAASRGIEQICASLAEPGLEHAHAVFLGFGSFGPWIDAMIGELAQGTRIHRLEAVPPEELLPWVASADIGLVPQQPTNLNLRLSTPNKLFEAIGAGIPVVASDFPEIARVVIDGPDGPLGAVCDPTSPASIAVAVRSILEAAPGEREALLERCRKAADQRWNWEIEVSGLVHAYASLSPRSMDRSQDRPPTAA
jgi:starch synthase